MTSIKDVAKSVGVSTATVSRALRGLPRVAEETRFRVLQAAADLDYVASPSAAGLATGQTRAVGVVVPFVSRWFYGEVVQGADTPLRDAGYDLLLYNLGGDRETRRRVFGTHLSSKRVDAVLVLSLTPTDEELVWLAKLDRPVAMVGVSVPGWSSVRIDDEATACIAMRHLLALGHRRIGYIGGTLEDQLDFAAPFDRLLGYRHSMADAGLDVLPQWEAVGDRGVRRVGRDGSRRCARRAPGGEGYDGSSGVLDVCHPDVAPGRQRSRQLGLAQLETGGDGLAFHRAPAGTMRWRASLTRDIRGRS